MIKNRCSDNDKTVPVESVCLKSRSVHEGHSLGLWLVRDRCVHIRNKNGPGTEPEFEMLVAGRHTEESYWNELVDVIMLCVIVMARKANK